MALYLARKPRDGLRANAIAYSSAPTTLRRRRRRRTSSPPAWRRRPSAPTMGRSNPGSVNPQPSKMYRLSLGRDLIGTKYRTTSFSRFVLPTALRAAVKQTRHIRRLYVCLLADEGWRRPRRIQVDLLAGLGTVYSGDIPGPTENSTGSSWRPASCERRTTCGRGSPRC